MIRRDLGLVPLLSLVVFIFTINTRYYTGYTRPLIDLSENICRLKLYLEKIDWYYTDYIEVSPGKYVFTAPIGTPLLLSIPICLLRDTLPPLFTGGLIMSLLIAASIIILYRIIRELDPGDKRYILTSITLSIFGSLPWIYSSHIFPQAPLTLYITASLYTSLMIIKSRFGVIHIRYVILNALFSGLMFLTDPSTTTLILSYTIYLLITIVSSSRKNFIYGITYLLTRSILWILVFSVFLLFQLYYDYVTTGDPFQPPELVYSNIRGLGTGLNLDPQKIVYAIYIQLIDFRKSLLVLYPLTIFLLIYLVLYRDVFQRDIWVLIMVYVIVPLITYSAWHDYHGGLSYGPRFLTPLTALLSIPLTYVLRTSPYTLHIIILMLTSYSIVENSIVLTTNVYPCAIQDLSPLENQFIKCSIKNLLDGERSSFIHMLLTDYLGLAEPLSTILSLVMILSIIYFLIMYLYRGEK